VTDVAVSRTMQQQKEESVARTGGTPIWVWAVYAVGILAATILVFSVLFTLGAYLLSNDVPVTMNVSVPAIVLWGGLTAIAGGLWIYRRRRR
jgi:LPXTG-motif cell wall-anchored protein